MSKNNSNKKNKNKVKKEKISQSVAEFVKNNRELLGYGNEFRNRKRSEV